MSCLRLLQYIKWSSFTSIQKRYKSLYGLYNIPRRVEGCHSPIARLHTMQDVIAYDCISHGIITPSPERFSPIPSSPRVTVQAMHQAKRGYGVASLKHLKRGMTKTEHLPQHQGKKTWKPLKTIDNLFKSMCRLSCDLALRIDSARDNWALRKALTEPILTNSRH